MFRDRVEAGVLLGDELRRRGYGPEVVVLGVPRGGVVVAAEVARVLGARLDIVASAKVGMPRNPEVAAGAVSPDGSVVANPASGYTVDQVRLMADAALTKSRHEVDHFRAGRASLDVDGRTAIIVDDGLATGLTAIASARYVRRQGVDRVVLAVPVAPPSAVERLAAEVDELVVLEVPEWFSAVGQFYRTFGQTQDDEVVSLLAAYHGGHAIDP